MLYRCVLTCVAAVCCAVAYGYQVINTNDAGAGSLRQAIIDANGHGGLDPVTFAIGTGLKTINLKSPLPTITDPIEILANGQPGYVDHPVIELNGASAGAGADGLRVSAQGCVIAGLCINRFSGNGISITGPGGNYVADCYIGTDPSGSTAESNHGAGVLITDSPNNTVYGGFSIFVQGNGYTVVSGNLDNGIVIDGPLSTGNVVTRCRIGVNALGSAALANSGDGVRITRQARSNTIGATTTHERNIISGNSQSGVHLGLTGGLNPSLNVVEGNYIGLNAGGSVAISNGRGVLITDANGNIIGGAAAGAGNTIAGNGTNVEIDGPNSYGNKVLGNDIGTNPTGTVAMGGAYGVRVESAVNNQIGGSGSGEGNVISGNSNTGVEIDNNLTAVPTGNTVQGNRIGIGTTGAAVPNGKGVYLYNASNTTVGGPTGRNYISGNLQEGVHIFVFGTNASGNTVQGNFIGLNLAGNAAIGNKGAGVFIQDAPGNLVSDNSISGNAAGIQFLDEGGSGGNATGNSVQGNRIGTDFGGSFNIGNTGDGITLTGDVKNNSISSNVISGNGGAGVRIQGNGAFTASGNSVSSNNIGTDLAGAIALGNANGVVLGQGAQNNSISANLISGNGDGVSIQGNGITGNSLVANLIGTNADGSAAIPNSQNGIRVLNGDTVIGPGNTVSGNTLNGVYLIGAGAHGAVTGNRIGTSANGSGALPNGGAGVRLESTVGITVGGGTPGAGNVISGNTGNGLEIAGISATGSQVQGNLIGTDATGMQKVANGAAGVLIEQSSGNVIGGTTADARNVISGNKGQGVFINATTVGGGYLATSQNTVQGNYIGTDVSGATVLGNGFDGILITDGSSNTIGGTVAGAGNVVSGNTSNGIRIIAVSSTAAGNSVLGNIIGLNAAGTSALGNGFRGIDVDGAAATVVGGTSAGSRNVISGNVAAGLLMHNKATGTVVLGNYIGTDASGTAAAGNGTDGVFIENAPANNVGGSAAGAGNVISGNGGYGIRFLDSDANHNVVQGNLIGLKADGTSALGNSGDGVHIKAADDNTIGGAEAGAANSIRYNIGAGIFVESGVNDALTRNSISANGGLSIDLFPAGPTPNDAGDGDPGANNLQNYPVLTSVSSDGSRTTVQGTLNSTANTAFTVEIYSSAAGDPSGYGEGETYLASTVVTTDAAGNAAFSTTFPASVPPGHPVTATATDPNGNTSEFSAVYPLYGDANADGAVDASDVVAILRAAGGLGAVTGFQNGDVAPYPSAAPAGFGDGRLNVVDAVRVLRHINGLETHWP